MLLAEIARASQDVAETSSRLAKVASTNLRSSTWSLSSGVSV